MSLFTPDVVSAVLTHMNTDHRQDNLIIVQAFGDPNASAATMTGLDAEAGDWVAIVDGAEAPMRIPWGTPVVERPDIRREVAMLYRSACTKLGIDARSE